MRVFLVLILSLLWAAPVAATSITQAGLTFSDELGGFELLSVSGSGSKDDPFVVTERVNGQGAAILTISGFDADFLRGQQISGAGFILEKVVINGTKLAWTAFELELRESLDQPSGYYDGLSFGQLARDVRPSASDFLPTVVVRDEPYDSIVFLGGYVEPEASVAFRMMITDITPVSPFYLLQRLQVDVVGEPPKLASSDGP